MPVLGELAQALGAGPGNYRIFAETVADASADVDTGFDTIYFASAAETADGSDALGGITDGTVNMSGTADNEAVVFAIGE